jgi:hypothetical protein
MNDHLEKSDLPCGNKMNDSRPTLGERIPFLERNRKRKYKRMGEVKTSTLQSLLLKQSASAVLMNDVCAPELNVPMEKKSATRQQRSQYQIHILSKETSGNVITSTMSFCLKAYQCHFCTFDGVRSESLCVI